MKDDQPTPVEVISEEICELDFKITEATYQLDKLQYVKSSLLKLRARLESNR